MIIHIQTWVLWTISLVVGIPLIVIIGFLAWLGLQFAKVLSKGIWNW